MTQTDLNGTLDGVSIGVRDLDVGRLLLEALLHKPLNATRKCFRLIPHLHRSIDVCGRREVGSRENGDQRQNDCCDGASGKPSLRLILAAHLVRARRVQDADAHFTILVHCQSFIKKKSMIHLHKNKDQKSAHVKETNH